MFFVLIKWINHNSVTVMEETEDIMEYDIGEIVTIRYGKKPFKGKIVCRSGK